MKKRKNRRKAKIDASADRRHHTRIAVIVGVGFALISAEFFCLPMIMPKTLTLTRVIHGDLISPPTQTNTTITAIVPPVKPAQIPVARSMPVTGAVGIMGEGPKANEEITEPTNGGYLQIGFDRLAAFPVQVINITKGTMGPSARPIKEGPVLDRPIPYSIKALDNRKIALTGFMFPLKVENGRATEFLLMRSRAMCCFGLPLKINEWVHVQCNGKGVKSIMDVPVTIYGTLHVGEIIKNGQMSSIYQLDGEEKFYFADFR